MIVNQINTDLLANAKDHRTNEENEYILRRHFQLHRNQHRHEYANTQFIMGMLVSKFFQRVRKDAKTVWQFHV